MKKRTYYSPANPPPRNPQIVSSHSNVETAGYISAKQQIQNLMMGGINLKAYREAEYDFKPDQEDDMSYEDPTRRPGFDWADATRLARENAQKHKQAVEAAKKAQEEKREEQKKNAIAEAIKAEKQKEQEKDAT